MMTQTGEVWSAGGVIFGNSPNQAFKFDVYGNWILNFGDAGLSGSAYQNGQNISVNSGATYNITFDEAMRLYHIPSEHPLTHCPRARCVDQRLEQKSFKPSEYDKN